MVIYSCFPLQVIVSPVTDVSSCERISLEPLSVDDWEILVSYVFIGFKV